MIYLRDNNDILTKTLTCWIILIPKFVCILGINLVYTCDGVIREQLSIKQILMWAHVAKESSPVGPTWHKVSGPWAPTLDI